MDFNGTWQVYSQENYEEFLRVMGEKTKPVTLFFVSQYKYIHYIWKPLMQLHHSEVKYNQTADACTFHCACIDERNVRFACQNFQKTSSRWPRASSPLLRSSRRVTTLLSPPRHLGRLWPTPLPSERRPTSPPWTARSSRFVLPWISTSQHWLFCALFLIQFDVQNDLLLVQVSLFWRCLLCELCPSSDLQCIVNLEGGKLVCNTGKFSHIQELKGGEMVEVWHIVHKLTHCLKLNVWWCHMWCNASWAHI